MAPTPGPAPSPELPSAFSSASLGQAALRAASAAGPALAEAFRRPMDTGTKTSAHDLVTIHDTRTEDLLVKLLREATPEASILGEEGGVRTPDDPQSGGTPALQWIIDPIDGTSNFAHGFGLFSISIAAELDGEVVAGVVHDPLHQLTFSADDSGAYLHSSRQVTPLHPASSRLASSHRAGPPASPPNLLTSFPSAEQIRAHPQWTAARFSELVLAHSTVRRVVSGALELCYAAAGWADVVLGVDTKPWDIAAGQFILRQAGGTFFTWDRHGHADRGPAHRAPHYVGLSARVDDAPGARAVAQGWAEVSAPTV